MLQLSKRAVTFSVLFATLLLIFLPFYLTVGVFVTLGVCVYFGNTEVRSVVQDLARGNSSGVNTLTFLFRKWKDSVYMSMMSKYHNSSTGFHRTSFSNGMLPQELRHTRSRSNCVDENTYTEVRNSFSKISVTPQKRYWTPSSKYSLSTQSGDRVEESLLYQNSLKSSQVSSSDISPWGRKISPSLRITDCGSKTVQTVAGPLLASTRFNYNLDSRLLADVNSPGLCSRIVNYANDSQHRKPKPVTHQSEYAGPGQFPVVHLNRSASILPLLSPKNSQKVARTPVRVRIAPPESPESRMYSLSDRSRLYSSNLTQSEESTKSVLEVLKEISRKRIHSQLGDEEDEEAKRQRKTDDSPVCVLPEDTVLQGKRPREESPQSAENVKRTRNEILSSLSSSVNLCSGGGKKRTAAADWSRSSTPVSGKHFKHTSPTPCAPAEVPAAPQPAPSPAERKEPEATVQPKQIEPAAVVEPKRVTSKPTPCNSPSKLYSAKTLPFVDLRDDRDVFKNIEAFENKVLTGAKSRLSRMMAVLDGGDAYPTDEGEKIVGGTSGPAVTTTSPLFLVSSASSSLPASITTAAVAPSKPRDEAQPATQVASGATTGTVNSGVTVSSSKPVITTALFNGATTDSGFGGFTSLAKPGNSEKSLPASMSSPSVTHGENLPSSGGFAAAASTAVVTAAKVGSSAPSFSTVAGVLQNAIPTSNTESAPLSKQETSSHSAHGTTPNGVCSPFATPKTAPSSTGFSFPAVSAPAAFGSAVTAPSSSFGAAPASTLASVTFGASGPAALPSPSFGAQNFTSPSSLTTFAAPTSTTTPSAVFGAQAATPTPSSSVLSAVGLAVAPSVSAFTAAASTTLSSTATFAAAGATVTSSSSVFGAAGSGTVPSTSLFGPTSNQNNPVLATSASPAAQTGAVFGTPSVTSTQATPMFGAATTTTQSGQFGALASATQPSVFSAEAATPSGAFGAAAPTAQAGIFGAPSATTLPSLFGTTVTTSQSSLFGVVTAAQPGVFGTPSATTTQSSMFGAAAATAQPSRFGAPAVTTTQPSMFGATAPATQPNMFGAATCSAMAGSTFGMPSASTAKAGGSQFGAQSATTQSNSVFGAPAAGSSNIGTSQPGGFKFDLAGGGAAASASNPLFGGFSTTATTTASTSGFQFGSPATSSKPGTFAFGDGGSGTPLAGASTAPSVTQAQGSFGSFTSAQAQPAQQQSLFAFGASSSAAPTPTAQPGSSSATGGGFTFGNGKTPTFGFGPATQPATSAGTFQFGASGNQTPSFQFGAGATSQPQSTPAFQFGSGANSNSTGFNFSGGTPNSTAPAVNFGAGPSTSGTFQMGSTPAFTTPSAPGQGMFSIGSGSTAPRARVGRSRRQR